jgi:hypothetical protein
VIFPVCHLRPSPSARQKHSCAANRCDGVKGMTSWWVTTHYTMPAPAADADNATERTSNDVVVLSAMSPATTGPAAAEERSEDLGEQQSPGLRRVFPTNGRHLPPRSTGCLPSPQVGTGWLKRWGFAKSSSVWTVVSGMREEVQRAREVSGLSAAWIFRSQIEECS